MRGQLGRAAAVGGAMALAGWSLAIGWSCAADAPPAAAAIELPLAVDRKIDFAKDVQPLLESRCYSCHGPKKQESSFRLDRKAAALQGGDNGKSIVPGKSEKSLLILALVGKTDVIGKMPEKAESLTREQIGLLRAWIDQGADWPETEVVASKNNRDHWAFKPPARSEPPKVKDEKWIRNEIDRFVLARLEKEGLRPSPEADRPTLLRRLSLDLIGLPPTIAELDAFLADNSPDAYDKQVDRLLKSPHFGERWGRHWLDAARYADSDGFEKDRPRTMYFYRDWVIDAYNRDLPYDQFIIQQIAGDQLPGATQDQIVATGFLRNSMVNEEGGADPEQFRMAAMFDRMEAVGKSMLGLTIQCAQCHTHKYDPLTHEEYYRLFAYLNNDFEPQAVVYTPAELMQVERLSREIRTIEAELQHKTDDWPEQLAKWEETVKAAQPQWTTLKPTKYIEDGGGAKILLLPDDSMISAGFQPTKCTFRISGQTELAKFNALRIDMLRHPNLPCGGPGRSIKGTFALSELHVEVSPVGAPSKKIACKIVDAAADYSQPEGPLEAAYDDRSGKPRTIGPVKFAFDGNNDTAWAIDAGPGRRNTERAAVFKFEKPVELTGGAIVTVSLAQLHGGWNADDLQANILGRFKISLGNVNDSVATPLPDNVQQILATARDRRSAVQTATLFRFWRSSVAGWKAENLRIEELWRQWPVGSTSLALQQMDDGRTTHLLKRGDWLKPADAVTAGVPSFLHSLPANAPPTRLTLARWLADKNSPTTARVCVNRIWQGYFGSGIVSTSEDFGTQCDPPSHPELLDWLACELMDRGWSNKAIHRLIVTSATYRQASKVTPELYAKDQYNRLLARGPRLRVEGEIVRDIALAASGLLNPKMGGPSSMPPAPAFLFLPPVSYAPFPWVDAVGEEKYRRAVYTYRRRSTPYPVLANFDVPSGDVSCVRRARSNTPLQSLTTLNETMFMEAAQALALRICTAGGQTDAERIAYGFRCCTSRIPTKEETAELITLIDQQKKRIAEGWVNAAQLATGKELAQAKLPAGVTPATLAAYTVVARVLLNLDETITKD